MGYYFLWKGAEKVVKEVITKGQVISEIEWKMILSASIVVGIYSLLTNVAGLPGLKE